MLNAMKEPTRKTLTCQVNENKEACLDCPLSLVCATSNSDEMLFRKIECPRCREKATEVTLTKKRPVEFLTVKFALADGVLNDDTAIPEECSAVKEEDAVIPDEPSVKLCDECRGKPLTSSEELRIKKLVDKILGHEEEGDIWRK